MFIPEPRALNIAVLLLSKVTILIVVSYQTHLQSQRAHAQYYVRCMLNAQLGLLASQAHSSTSTVVEMHSVKVIHPKYYTHLKKGACQSHLGRLACTMYRIICTSSKTEVQQSLDLRYHCVPKKHSLARNSLGRGLFYVVNVLRYFKVVQL